MSTYGNTNAITPLLVLSRFHNTYFSPSGATAFDALPSPTPWFCLQNELMPSLWLPGNIHRQKYCSPLPLQQIMRVRYQPKFLGFTVVALSCIPSSWKKMSWHLPFVHPHKPTLQLCEDGQSRNGQAWCSANRQVVSLENRQWGGVKTIGKKRILK